MLQIEPRLVDYEKLLKNKKKQTNKQINTKETNSRLYPFYMGNISLYFALS